MIVLPSGKNVQTSPHVVVLAIGPLIDSRERLEDCNSADLERIVCGDLVAAPCDPIVDAAAIDRIALSALSDQRAQKLSRQLCFFPARSQFQQRAEVCQGAIAGARAVFKSIWYPFSTEPLARPLDAEIERWVWQRAAEPAVRRALHPSCTMAVVSRHLFDRLGICSFCLSQEGMKIQWFGNHIKFALRVAGPLRLWPIPIEFDAVIIGVSQV